MIPLSAEKIAPEPVEFKLDGPAKRVLTETREAFAAQLDGWQNYLPEPLREVLYNQTANGWEPTGLANLLIAVLIFAGALAVRWVVIRLINRVVDRALHARERDRQTSRWQLDTGAVSVHNERRRQRARAIGAILRSAASFVVIGTAVLMGLDRLGLNIGPVLASASVLGFAIGFGAQNLIKDFLAGVFMILEDQFGVGDTIELDKVTGEVEDVGLRTTRLRDGNGAIWYVRNGEITRVSNRSQGHGLATVEAQAHYLEDVDRLLKVVEAAAHEAVRGPGMTSKVLGDPVVKGVRTWNKDALTVQVEVKTVALADEEVATALRGQLKRAFDREGVRGPSQEAATVVTGEGPLGQ